MVNTRNNQCNGQFSNNNNNNNANPEQLLTTQNQLMQAMLQTLNNMQPNQQQAPSLPPPHQSRLAEFVRTRPTTFSQAKDPMDAEDWLKGVEKKLVIAQCTDRENVLFAAHQLYGTTANWWEMY
jgi:predicted XRE-type DNA-binding protein